MRRVVVTGMGVISPVGNTVETFFENLAAGNSGIRPITRFDTADYKVKIAAEVKGFDPVLYMEKHDIRRTDLFSQYATAAAVQAMADADLAGKIAPDRLAVSFGSGIGGLITLSEQAKVLVERGPGRISPHFIPMMIANMAAGNIAIRFGAMGSCTAVVTACATGTDAVGEGYRRVLHGYADAVITGGAEAAVTPLGVAGFTNCMALSNSNDPKTASLPFDARRTGFVMGEGAGCLILEEYERAKARGARIYAEVVGYSNTNDAHHVTAPHPEALGAAAAIRQALPETLPDAAKIYYNAHGTGTPLNDAAETVALKKAFGDSAYRIAVSSTKSMTGHMLGATGAAEAIVCVMALRTGAVPPTIHLDQPDPDCDLDYTPNKAAVRHPDLALSASFGFGGHNACIAFKKVIE